MYATMHPHCPTALMKLLAWLDTASKLLLPPWIHAHQVTARSWLRCPALLHCHLSGRPTLPLLKAWCPGASSKADGEGD